MEWITLILPLIRAGAELVQTFRDTNGRDPTDAELTALLAETDSRKAAADAGWAASTARRIAGGE